MEKFVVRNKRLSNSSVGSSTIPNSTTLGESENIHENVGASREKRARMETTCEGDVISDPALRKPINEYDSQVRDDVKREYVLKGPCQPSLHEFPRSDFGKKSRCFQASWFKKWKWLEYSVSKDAAFCFWCYLFKEDKGKRFGDEVFVKTGLDEVFVKTGFRNWKKASEKFRDHVGATGSAHNNARTLFFAFKDQMQSLTRIVCSGKQVLGTIYHTHLTAFVEIVRLLLGQGLTFRGHEELAGALNRGIFLEFLDWYSSFNLDVGKAMKENAPANHLLTSPRIQKEIISACELETTKAIISDIGDKFFSLLIDEVRDCSVKEQMAIILRYVSNHGVVVERFLGVIHVVETSAVSLKSGIDEFFAKHGLSISKLRGQGYNGASNLREDLNGLKTLILSQNPCARYILCFAHQLQLVIVAASQKNQFVSDFFEHLSMISDMVRSSCKRKDEVQQKQHENMVKMLENGESSTGRVLKEETKLAQPKATRWGSHYLTILRLISLWPSTVQVLENIFDDGADLKTRGVAASMVEKMESYQFVFIAHLMKLLLGLTNVLSQFLQQKDHNIIQAVSIVQSTRRTLQGARENGWDQLLGKVNSFCSSNGITIVKMEDSAPTRFHQ